MSAGLRLFVAADPPAAARDELAQWARHAIGRGSPARRLPAASLHLTLCFLGDHPPSAVAEVAAVLGAAAELAAAIDTLHVGAPLWLPPRRPRVLAVEVADPSGALAALHAGLCRELSQAIDWEPPRQRFRPHITLARMRAGSERARALPPTPPLTFGPDAVALFRSELDPEGATYTRLASIPR